jgi:tripartite-type tricarboxylate transporter receptor subunit TctC
MPIDFLSTFFLPIFFLVPESQINTSLDRIKMKKLIVTFLISLCMMGAVSAKTCGVVIEFPPGGAADRYARLLQKYNPEFHIEYKVGASGAIAVAFAGENPEFIYFASPSAFGKSSSFKTNPPIDLYKILIGSSNIVVTGKQSIDINKLMTGTHSVGIGSYGIPQHVIAEQLKNFNPNLTIVPMGGDTKALPLLINGDLDVYITSAISGTTWIDQFKQIKPVMTVDFNKPFINGDLKVESVGFIGAFTHRNATPAQRQKAIECLEKAISQPGWTEELKSMNANPVMVSGKHKDTILQQYLTLLRKFDL